MHKEKDRDIGSLFFHGTLAESVPGIMAKGVRCTTEEPCFTRNLILACCRYANRGRNSNHIYSGKIFADAQNLIRQGLLKHRGKKERLLEETRKYWDANDSGSVVFVLFPAPFFPGPAAAARLALDPQNKVVSGGITKWIEGHTAFYHHNKKPVPGVRGRQKIIFKIKSSPELRNKLTQYRDVIVGLKDDIAIAPQLNQLIISHIDSLPGNNPPLETDGLLEKILEQTAVTTLLSEIRRGFLSILRSRGYTIYKTDHHPPYVEVSDVFWPENRIDRNVNSLFSSITKRYASYKDLAAYIEMIKDLREKSSLLNSPGTLHKKLDESTFFYD